jgi:hypothetical protein
MAKTPRADVQVGDIWRARDVRSWHGNRRVRVTRVVRDGAVVTVHYRQVVGLNTHQTDQVGLARADRFQRAFRRVGTDR